MVHTYRSPVLFYVDWWTEQFRLSNSHSQSQLERHLQWRKEPFFSLKNPQEWLLHIEVDWCLAKWQYFNRPPWDWVEKAPYFLYSTLLLNGIGRHFGCTLRLVLGCSVKCQALLHHHSTLHHGVQTCTNHGYNLMNSPSWFQFLFLPSCPESRTWNYCSLKLWELFLL